MTKRARHAPAHGGNGCVATLTCTPVSKRQYTALCGSRRIFMHPGGYIRQKAAELGIFDRPLEFGTKRPLQSRHFDSPGHCKSMLPGFCFSCGFPLISALQPSRLQRGGKARFSALKNLLPHFSVNIRSFLVSKCPV